MKGKGLKKKLRGVHVIVYSPFKPNLEVDEEGLREHTRYLIDHGIKNDQGVLIPTGSGSECGAMTTAERKRIVEIVVEEARGEVPVVPGCNHSSTRIVIDLARHAREVGADGVMVIAPYYFKGHSNEAIFRHYQALSDAVDIGIFVYNNPSITGVDMPIELVRRLAELKNVAGIKECSPIFRKQRYEQMLLGDKIAIVSGRGECAEPFHIMLGQPGYVSHFANFLPGMNVELYKAAESGDVKRAIRLSDRFAPLNSCIDSLGASAGAGQGVALLKECARLAGRPGAIPRPPLLAATAGETKELKTQLASLGVV